MAVTDDLIEAVARAIGDSADEMHVSQLRLAAQAAIRAAAPLILDMAAEHCRDYLFDCLDDRDVQRGWPQTLARNQVYAEHILELKERFQ